jgi:hypothetical protein
LIGDHFLDDPQLDVAALLGFPNVDVFPRAEGLDESAGCEVLDKLAEECSAFE